MIVPKFWAEARAQQQSGDRQVTVRRFGWSDESEVDAQTMANTRAQEALARAVAGEKILRREPRRAYNGAVGVPIREEIVSRHGDTIITRNTYGARCLNTPDVLFVDIDLVARPSLVTTFDYIVPLFAAAVAAWALSHRWFILATGIGVLFVVQLVWSARLRRRNPGGADAAVAARERLAAFATAHPEWRLRLYETPAGLRALAMHRTFRPDEAEVAECFAKLGADPVYVKMCVNQRCFRARVSPKPWRLGISDHIVPRTGAWPVPPELQPARSRWVEAYERAAQNHAACRFLESVGNGTEHPSARAVQALHDELCRAKSALPTA